MNLTKEQIIKSIDDELHKSEMKKFFKDKSKTLKKHTKEKISKVAGEVIASLKRTLDYNGYYIARLLDQISEEEFDEISKEYVIETTTEITDELVEKVRILFLISNLEYTPSDISEIFGIEITTADEILKILQEQKCIQ